MSKKIKNQNKEIEKEEEIVAEIDLDAVEETEEVEEEKEVTVMDMLNRIVVCLVVIAILLAVNTVVLICKDGTVADKKEENKTTETTNTGSGSTEGYDVSMMKEVDVDGILDMFNDKKGTYVLYIGRSTCGACVSYLPTLQQAQADLGYTTQYLDITKVDSTKSNFETFTGKLSKDYTMTVSGEEQTHTFGYWFGYTPMTIIIQNGKMVDGEIGAISYDTLTDMLAKYNIGK